MADDCKRTLEFTVPVEAVDAETNRVISNIQRRAKLPGFRPGKAPASIIKSRFASDIRQDVIEALAPKAFREQAEKDNLNVVGSPGITDIHFHEGEPLRFKVEFEVAPEFDLGEYRELTVPYNEPRVTDEDVEARLQAIREDKAEYVNVDPRPIASGDYAVVALSSLSGLEGEPIKTDETVLLIGDDDTLKEFNENLTGLSPDDEKEFDVTYPEDYGNKRLAGNTIRFHVTVKGIRRKELPELNDEFAADIGDFKDLTELREELRRGLLRDRENIAQNEAKGKLIETLVDAHEFPVPDTFIDRQIEMNLESRFRELAAQGIDPRQLKIDWAKLRDAQREPAIRDVKASLILDKIAGREAIETMEEDIDREVARLSRQMREPPAALRMRLEKDGTLRRIASRIRTDKVLSFLFDHARKVAAEAPEAQPEAEAESEESAE